MSNIHWILNEEQYEFIKGEATHILVRYGVKCVPISGFEIALRMGIKLIPYSALNVKKNKIASQVSHDGFLCEYDNLEYIFYNDDMPYERQNWTILHELGHIALDHTGHGTIEEAEADFFAKFIIAPPILIYKVGAESIEDIHKLFDISWKAAEYSFNYYQKWRKKHQNGMIITDYEKEILQWYNHNQYQAMESIYTI